jgi:translation initiation factor IF-3
LSNINLNINNQIRAKEVRLIDSEGVMVGVVSIAEAMSMAMEVELDLVEISPNSDPPVCKIADFGKIRYQKQKKLTETKKKQKAVELKEIKMSVNIADGDYNTKIKQAKKFFEERKKVKFSFQFHGREINYSYLGEEMSLKIIDDLKDYAKVDIKPQLEGKKMFFVMSSTVKK